ncbi:MAG: (2Fe-2S)-binding protein [Proteobacteria bacterium]|nr:(2Fe-2S)-binding protein [Pseudomonadota bacterium]
MKLFSVTLVVNGRAVTLRVEARQSLADALRGELGLTGTHLGCEHGVCGACTVLLDGEPVRGCLLLAVQTEGTEVTTIEGISPPAGLNELQESFRRHHALQCGYCTPGMVLSLHALLARDPTADEEAIREAISGNLCRCTGYLPILQAALHVAQSNRLKRADTSSTQSSA